MYKKPLKKSIRPCIRCRSNYIIFNRSRWFCRDCDKEVAKERKGDLKGLFLEIWDERSHFCVHCGENLGEEPKAIYFSHIKARSTHPELKMEKTNIELLCGDCHHQYDFGDREKFLKESK